MKNIEAQIPPEGYYQRKFVKKYDPVDNIPHQSDLVDKALLDLYDKDNEFLAQKNIQFAKQIIREQSITDDMAKSLCFMAGNKDLHGKYVNGE